jgi:hypothetical protein
MKAAAKIARKPICCASKLSIMLQRFANLGLPDRPRHLTLGVSAATASFEIALVEGAIIAISLDAFVG